MPSEKILSQKQAYVAELREKIAGSVAGVVVDYKGINVADDTKLRKELREAGVEYAVVKNTMLRLAIKDTGIEGMSDVLEGSTALAISKEDPIVAAKILNKFAEDSKGAFSIKAGYMDGAAMTKAGRAGQAARPRRPAVHAAQCPYRQPARSGRGHQCHRREERRGRRSGLRAA